MLSLHLTIDYPGTRNLKTNLLFSSKTLKWILLSVLVGLLAGLVTSLFLISLDYASITRVHFLFIIWFLPLAGLFIGLAYQRFGKATSKGNNLILEEIYNPKEILPFRLAPMLFISSFLTHLFGGSAGREGAIVQVSASLADQVNHFFKINSSDRKILLMAGVGAGFGSAVGAPLAGMIFGMEIVHIGKLNFKAWPQCLIASLTSYYTCRVLKTSHSFSVPLILPKPSFTLFFYIILAGIIFGISALIFSLLTHYIDYTFKNFFKKSFIIPLFGGFIIIFFYYLEGSYRYAGLGTEFIHGTFEIISSFKDPFFKIFFTSLTVGTGFKGGEFIPLVFIGSTLGSALGMIMPISFSLLAALGFGAVFAGAANTPLACALMTAEIFGWKIFFYALLTCYLSYYFSGHSGIYRSQFIYRKKHHHFSYLLNLFKRQSK